MTKTKTTKRALLGSAISLILCFAMLLGTTYAWFTDSVTSGNNIIKSGTLDVTMEWANATDAQKDYKDASNVAIFNYDLWEPGYVDAKNIKISNVGTLALKYALNIVANGEVSILADVIDVYFAEEELTLANRDLSSLEKIGTLREVLAGMPANSNGELYPKGNPDGYSSEATVTLALKMQESAGNDYQNKSIGTDFSVELLATQLTYEKDSFDDQYDKNSGWTGQISQPKQDDNGVFQIGSPEELAWFAKYVNGTLPMTFAARAAAPEGHNAVLTADINLNNLPWTPIGRTITDEEKAAGAHPFDYQFHGQSNVAGYAVFDGQGHTVYNLNVEQNQNAGLFGAAVYAVIKNVNVTGANIVSNHFAGTILAQGYARVENCHVKDSKVTCTTELINGSWDNGDKVGGVVGKISEGGANSIYGVVDCSATDVNVSAYRDFGGILGYAGDYAKVTGNKIENVKLTQDATHDYKAFKTIAEYKIGAIVGDSTRSKGVVVEDNNGEAVIVPMVASSTALKDAVNTAKEGDTVAISGEVSLPSLLDKTGVTFDGAEGAVIGGKNASTGFASNFGNSNTFKNLEFSGSSNGVRWSYANGGTSTFENCTFAGDSTYGFHIDQSNAATFIFNNCTFIGFNAFASDLVSVTFNNCKFLSNGSYGHTNIWSVGKFNNCTWGDNTSVSTAGSGKIYFDDVEESYHHEFIGSAESLFAFAKSVNEGNDSWSGQKVILVDDIDLKNAVWTPIGQTGATTFRGNFDGKNHTISNLNIDSSKQTGEHYSSGLFGWVESPFSTISNIKVENATVKGNHNVAVIAGYLYGDIVNCHVSKATIVCSHANDEACGDKSGAIVGYAGPPADSTYIKDCSAKECTITAGRDAGQLIGCGYNASVSGCSATDVTVSAKGDCTGKNINNAIIGRVMD